MQHLKADPSHAYLHGIHADHDIYGQALMGYRRLSWLPRRE